MLFEDMRFEVKDGDIVCTNGIDYVYMTAGIHLVEPDYDYGLHDRHAVGACVRPFTGISIDDPDPRNRHNVDIADQVLWDDARSLGNLIGIRLSVQYEVDDFEDDFSEKYKTAEAMRVRIAAGDIDLLNALADRIRAGLNAYAA